MGVGDCGHETMYELRAKTLKTPYRLLSRDKKDRHNQYRADWVQRNKERVVLQRKIHRLQIKIEVMSHYSNGKLACVCCGEDNPLFLTLDHKNNNGKEHRDSLVEWRRTGFNFYRWLRKNNYPNDPLLIVSCWNCNCARGFYGYCPHQSHGALNADSQAFAEMVEDYRKGVLGK